MRFSSLPFRSLGDQVEQKRVLMAQKNFTHHTGRGIDLQRLRIKIYHSEDLWYLLLVKKMWTLTFSLRRVTIETQPDKTKKEKCGR